MICWHCHSNSVYTGSRLPNISDVKTQKDGKHGRKWQDSKQDLVYDNELTTKNDLGSKKSWYLCEKQNCIQQYLFQSSSYRGLQ